MNVRLVLLLLILGEVVGCRAHVEIDDVRQARQVGNSSTRDAHQTGADHSWSAAIQLPQKRLPFDGLWIAAGWMGDAESISGPLERRVCREDYHSQPSCEQWVYTPTESNSIQRWCAVAYQYPPGGYNFGEKPGKDLSGQGYTHVTFWARSASSTPVRLIVKSGGHTSDGAAYPASYSAELGQVELAQRWQRFSLPIGGLDHSNVTCALAFVLLAENGPATFLIDDLAFEGP